MVDLLKKIFEVNNHLISLLKTNFAVEQDDYTEQIEHYLNLREQLFANVQKAKTSEEKELGQQIMNDNELINQLLKEKTLHIKREINRFNVKKKNNQHYDNPYQNTSFDGIFIDKKK